MAALAGAPAAGAPAPAAAGFLSAMWRGSTGATESGWAAPGSAKWAFFRRQRAWAPGPSPMMNVSLDARAVAGRGRAPPATASSRARARAGVARRGFSRRRRAGTPTRRRCNSRRPHPRPLRGGQHPRSRHRPPFRRGPGWRSSSSSRSSACGRTAPGGMSSSARPPTSSSVSFKGEAPAPCGDAPPGLGRSAHNPAAPPWVRAAPRPPQRRPALPDTRRCIRYPHPSSLQAPSRRTRPSPTARREGPKRAAGSVSQRGPLCGRGGR